jgi:hypothetical protein
MIRPSHVNPAPVEMKSRRILVRKYLDRVMMTGALLLELPEITGWNWLYWPLVGIMTWAVAEAWSTSPLRRRQ